MSVEKINHTSARSPIARAMDVTMIATTIGSAAIANMIFPSLGSAVIGAILGAIFGYRATKSA
ncbi:MULTISPECIES: hypothetical protein [unclassified Pseudomonas]|uniref:hypothetical protein n=1 Tax=unclassified Pseudomonas TaxID=196821 RepID=UPI002AC9CF14|nr:MULTISPECIES: hypothetical protein [unclassified Pseudomonas]MEB0039259.1 hypothetical protein [Pseudomonas sp. MH10]MEB0076090.1 hypothetical protein [Pseudomonas sp. MH10out]MEB0090803.1 hypothetical protein [Pseudomonas sp. CCI4.2]MEB0100109.1 hypothetical protein [Pseudomonas sp. CCI3.2]MEB0119698.1 hypothetical protein [Pseudomonas sp. CCI1.2]